MKKVLITVIKSECRSGHFSVGDRFTVDDLCPPLCHELWNRIYPYVFALQNGGELDRGEEKARFFEMSCPDEGRVAVRCELCEKQV
ncbi:MAG: TIGR04076 family protein [Clostridia bacterium]|nr:TIGR04076 family protein [Clostridia bacterium]